MCVRASDLNIDNPCLFLFWLISSEPIVKNDPENGQPSLGDHKTALCFNIKKLSFYDIP